MDIKTVQEISAKRCDRWHQPEGISQWSSLEWAGAMCGEAGEAANIAKKLRRFDLEIYNGKPTPPGFVNADTGHHSERAQLLDNYGYELADTFLYLVLCAEREGLDLEQYVRDAFNEKSIEAGFPERL